MQFPQMLLVLSTLLTLACTFPTGKDHGNSTDLSQNTSKVLDFSVENAPIMIGVEEKSPNFGSVIVEFVYNGNSITDTEAMEKNKYVIGLQKNEDATKQKANLQTKEFHNIFKAKKTENTDKKNPVKAEESVADSKAEEKYEILGVTTFVSEEVSPLFAKWPKHLFDVFSPVQPFPELQHKKSSQIQVKKVKIPTANVYFTTYEKEKKDTPDTAGPKLNPLSIYDREFAQPIFD